MNKQLKQALIIFGGGFLLFLAFKRLRPLGSGKKKSKSTTTSDTNQDQKKNAMIVLKAYGDALKAGENKAFMDEMNVEFAKTYQMKVMPDKTSKKLIAVDLQGNKVM